MTIQGSARFIDRLNNPMNITFKTANYTMTAEDETVITDAAAATAITLPPVAEAAGRLYSVKEVSGTHDVTISAYDADNDAPDWTDVVLTVAEDRALFYSDGYHWWVLVDMST